MIVKRGFLPVFLFLCSINFLFGQALTFHSPVPWITLRESNIVVKALIDTAEVKKNSIKLTLSKVENGRKTQLGGKAFKTEDYSFEYEMAKPKKNIIGGDSYLMVDWSVSGTDKKGVIKPFGLVKFEKDPLGNQVKCEKLSCAIEPDAVKNVLQEDDFVVVGECKFCPVWDDKVFGIVFKNAKETEDISFVVDGKNGKNAFLSFSDRELQYFPKSDSLSAVYYRRTVTDKVIEYRPEKWINEIKESANEELHVISVPWYDLAINPADGRIFGFSAFTKSAKKSAGYPEKANKLIPGTWGNVVLVK
jgi:hypothetical protein